MAALQEALKILSPIEYSSLPAEDDQQLKSFISETFANAQLLIDSIPIAQPAEESPTPQSGRSRSNTATSITPASSHISLSNARPTPPAFDVESLQAYWGKPVRLNAKENPLGISVYKLAGKDGRGAWFARRSIHEGLGFDKWKKGLEREFPQTMKIQGRPGEGNIRGIGGEKRVEYKAINGVGKMEVYHLSAQFPGPTTPRDFVTLLLTSESALTDRCSGLTEDKEIPRHFMVVSKPCIHPECPEREGFIRGQYQSVEFIREIPLKKSPKKSASMTNLVDKGQSRKRSDSTALGREAILRNAKEAQQQPIGEEEGGHHTWAGPSSSETNLLSADGRRRGKTISYAESRGWDAKGEQLDVSGVEADEAEINPVEWIMLTRSDPGGSVPRFMVERGTPSSIVADATKFLDWACSIDTDELDEDIPELLESGTSAEAQKQRRTSEKVLHDYQTNGHLAGLDGARDPPPTDRPIEMSVESTKPAVSTGGGIYGMVTGAVSAAGPIVAAHTPAMIPDHPPGHTMASSEVSLKHSTSTRRMSASSIDSTSSDGSFASALDGNEDSPSASIDNLSTRTDSSFVRSRGAIQQEKELQKLEDRKRKLDERLAKTREREQSKKSEDNEKEAQAMAKAEEKHQKEVAKQEEKYRREVAKLTAKKEKEERRAEEKRKKAMERDERTRLTRELEEVKADRDVLRVERDLLRQRLGDLQAENTALATRLGKLGAQGEAVLKEVQEEVKGGRRSRAASLKALGSKSPSHVRGAAVVVEGGEGGGGGVGGSQKENAPR